MAGRLPDNFKPPKTCDLGEACKQCVFLEGADETYWCFLVMDDAPCPLNDEKFLKRVKETDKCPT